jgi:hypothetical protein
MSRELENLDHNKEKSLLIGTIPPPIGGVTIHVLRTIRTLTKNKINIKFVDYKRTSLLKIIMLVSKYGRIVIHANNYKFILPLILISRLFLKQTRFVVHGQLRVASFFNKILEKICCKLTSQLYVLNDKDLLIGKSYNKNCYLISAFIPPDRPSISENIKNKIACYKKAVDVNTVFCTNAYKYVLNDQGEEIYGIIELIKIFEKHKQYLLIISDPSSTYKQKLLNDNYTLPENILLISEPHDFCPIIKTSDCLIRNTTTDGDSLSIHEALYYGKQVLATDCVPRPEGVRIYTKVDSSQLKNIHTKKYLKKHTYNNSWQLLYQ